MTIGAFESPTDTSIVQAEGMNLTVCMHSIFLSSNPELEPALAVFFGTITTRNGTAVG